MSLKSHTGLRCVITATFCLSLLGAIASDLSAENLTKAPAGVFVYAKPDGESYFAVSLRSEKLPSNVSIARTHVILVDTSASQIGAHRKQSFDVLQALLKSLPSDHHVSLIAVDVAAKKLTSGFVSPTSDEIQTALSALKRRVPLGATDLNQAVTTGLRQLEADQVGSIVYIGDGMSTANLVQSANLKKLLKQLVTRKIALHSYVVGARTDLQLPGIFAHRTGGTVLLDQMVSKEETPVVIGKKLASAVTAPVFYPETISTNQNGRTLLPNVALPLRDDRDTIYLGKGTLTDNLIVSVTGQLHGEDNPLRWRIMRKHFIKSKPHLAALYQQAESNQGLSVALAGMELMDVASEQFESRIDQLVSMGERAVVRRKADQTEAIVRLIQKNDPVNAEAKSLLDAADRLRGRFLAQADQQADNLKNRETPPAQPKSLLDQEKKRIQIITQKLTLETSRTIERANAMSNIDPDGALLGLKEVLGSLLAETDMDPAARAQLIRRVRNAMLDMTNKKDVNELSKIRATQKRAQLSAKHAQIEEMQIEEKKLEDLIDQVRAAISRGERGDDNGYEEAESIAEVAVDMRPGNGPATAAQFNSEAAGQINKAFRMRALRADRFLETLYQVELSHVPFPDEPPIRWPSAPVWKALTELRRKWKSVDLRQESPAEQRIRSELSRQTELELFDIPLTDAMEQIREQHQINIVLDQLAIEEAGGDLNEIVNFQLSGLKLRSALKIILGGLQVPLTYIVEDEVMKITTVEEADAVLSTRVYPVGDLVITPEILSLMAQQGGGQQGGGFGGGQQGGGLGGGQGGGGYGGGQGGGGFGGGGGGFFSLPPEDLSVKSVKKKQ